MLFLCNLSISALTSRPFDLHGKRCKDVKAPKQRRRLRFFHQNYIIRAAENHIAKAGVFYENLRSLCPEF